MIPATADALAAAGVEIEHHWIADEVYSKRTRMRAGTSLRQHSHPYAHSSALVKGRVLLEVEGTQRYLTAPAMLLIPAGKQHTVTALTYVVWHCLHITDDTDPETVDQTILEG